MIKTSKNKATNFKLLKIILTIAVGLVCIYQFKKINFNNLNNLTLTNTYALFFVLLLVIPNYLMEYFKWKAIIRSTNNTVSKSVKVQSFFAGIITGMLTPNMQGNFLGRIYYFPRKFRLPVTLLTLTSNLAQFCVTILLGIIALSFSKLNLYCFLIVSIAIVSLIFYFSFERLPFFKKRFKWYTKMQLILEKNRGLRWEFLIYSLLRNIIFSFQFLLALFVFGATINLEIYLLIWVLYLFTTLSPSLIFGKLFVRESIALWIFASLIPEPNIVAASFSIWIINLLLPTLLGLIICKRKVK